MMYRSLALAVAALWTSHAAAADMQSVYVAPGGVYVPSGHVYVAPGQAYPAPTYAAPAPAIAPPPVYGPAPSYDPRYERRPQVYAPDPGYDELAPVEVEREPTYARRERTYARRPTHAAETAPRPPSAVPYHGRPTPCTVDLGYGRWAYCD